MKLGENASRQNRICVNFSAKIDECEGPREQMVRPIGLLKIGPRLSAQGSSADDREIEADEISVRYVKEFFQRDIAREQQSDFVAVGAAFTVSGGDVRHVLARIGVKTRRKERFVLRLEPYLKNIAIEAKASQVRIFAQIQI